MPLVTMFKTINRIMISLAAVLINTMLGIVGEYFGYTVLDKVGIVFIAGLCDIYTTLAVAILTPAALSLVFRDPLIAWKIPSYIIYALFIYIAIGGIMGRLKKPALYQLFIASLFIITGVILLMSGYILFVMTGLSVMSFGVLLCLMYFAPYIFRFRVPMRFIGAIAIALAPFLLVMMDITVYSFMVTNILAEQWIEAFRRTLTLLIIDSAGPLVLFGIIWLALDLQTILRETQGKISDKRRFIGLILLLLVLFPIPTYIAARTMGIERGVRERIEMALPTTSEWSINEMRMSYIWSPIGASGVVFITYPATGHYEPDNVWYQAGINFYLIQGKEIVDVDRGYLDNLTLQRLIVLQFIAWLKPQKVRAEDIEIIAIIGMEGPVIINNTKYINITMRMHSYTDMTPTKDIVLQLNCYVTYIRELSRVGVIICYGEASNFSKLSPEFIHILESFTWI